MPQEGRGAPIDVVDDEGDAQLVSEAVGLLGPVPDGAPVIWVNAALELTVGKAAAQVGHASMLFAAERGLTAVPPFAVRSADAGQWSALCAEVERGAAVAVRDAGFTEVAPGTMTAISRWS